MGKGLIIYSSTGLTSSIIVLSHFDKPVRVEQTTVLSSAGNHVDSVLMVYSSLSRVAMSFSTIINVLVLLY